jgi:nucleoside-diphosphate-sugar epimerase
MRVLVTGAAGLLGRSVVERLLARGSDDIRCLVRQHSDHSVLQDLAQRYPQARIECMGGNLTAPDDARRAVEGIDLIYHLASGMRGLPATLFLNTVVASQRLLDAIRGTDTRVVLVSSVGVYGAYDLQPGGKVAESASLDPHPHKRSAYFHAKIWQEKLFRQEAEKSHRELVVLRPGVLYGSGQPGIPGRVGPVVGSVLLQFGGNRSLLPLSHVKNCAEAVILAGGKSEASGQAYNVVDDNLPTVRRYVSEYRQHVKKLHTVQFPVPAGLLLSRLAEGYRQKSHGQIPAILTEYESRVLWGGFRFDNQKIKDLGWTQLVSTEEGLRQEFHRPPSLPQTTALASFWSTLSFSKAREP